MNSIGILYICTGKYACFWKEFYQRCEKFFLLDCEKHYYVWTDSKEIIDNYSNVMNIHIYYQAVQPWPLPTLMRYNYFLAAKNDLKKMDFLIFMNGNLMVQKEILSRDVLPREGEKIFVTLHPGYFCKAPIEYTYDDNPNCRAYIPNGKGKLYFAGGLNGGRTEEFILLMEELNNRIQLDYKEGIVALWHDESHLNKYMYEYQKKYRILSPAYLYPEDYSEEIPFDCKILIMNKTKLGGHNFLRNIEE